MCRMFGFRSAVPSGAHRSLIAAENALADQSVLHPDGWGIGWFVDDDAYVIKSTNAAHACARFERASHRLTSHTFLVHVRRATVGLVDHVNAHPFRFGRWLFAHNGTIFGFDRLQDWFESQIHPQLLPLILGDTDSEHLFFFLLSRLDAAGVDRTGRERSDAATVGAVVRSAMIEIDSMVQSLGIDRPILNVLDDGTIIWKKKILYEPGMQPQGTDPIRKGRPDYYWKLAETMKLEFVPWMETDYDAGLKMDLPDDPILIRADRNTPFKFIQRIMEVCSREGIFIWKVQLAASEPEIEGN